MPLGDKAPFLYRAGWKVIAPPTPRGGAEALTAPLGLWVT